MFEVARGTFKGTNAELRAQIDARVDAFKQALADHAKTAGAPAPRENPLIERLARTNEPYSIEAEPPPPPPPPTPEELAALELAAKRAAAIRALEEERLNAALQDAGAPQEVKDYAAALGR